MIGASVIKELIFQIATTNINYKFQLQSSIEEFFFSMWVAFTNIHESQGCRGRGRAFH